MREPQSGTLNAGVRAPALAVSLLMVWLPGTSLAAQGNNHNEVMRFAARDLVQTATHPTTNYPLEVPGAQPAAFMARSTTGVPAGTTTWIWYPSQLNMRHEDRFVTGHMIAVRPSSATPLAAYSQTHPGQSSPGVPIYIPAFSIYPARVRTGATTPFGKGFDPDFGRSPLFTYNTVHTPLLQPGQADRSILWSVTYNTRIKVSSQEMVLAYEWKGADHAAKPLSQSLPTGWSEAMFRPSHWGWATPGPNRTITRFDPAKILPPPSTLIVYTSPMGGYFENQVTIAMHSDWGETRNPALVGSVYPSYNVGSGLADVGTRAGALGWDVFTSSRNQGMRALPIANFRLFPHPVGTPFLGNILELDPTDPALPLLWGNPLVDGIINANGVWLPAQRLAVPALGPAAIGLWFGVEFGLLDTVSGALLETTQGHWFYIEK